MSKVEIKSVKIAIGEKVIELTADEAHRLHEALQDLLGTPGRNTVTLVPLPYPTSYPYYPIIPPAQPYIPCGLHWNSGTSEPLSGGINASMEGATLCLNGA